MTDYDILKLVKLNLQNPPDAMDEFITHLIQSAEEAITEKGISLDKGSAEDIDLIVMYASWLYLKRNGERGMPRMLRYSLHSRLVAEKGKVSE